MSFREMWPSAPLLLTNRFTNFFTNMGKKKADPGHDPIPGKGLESYIEALRKQLSDKQRVIRAFDVGGSGVKTGLLTASALQDFLHWGGQAPGQDSEDAHAQLEWIEKPVSLGMAPGEDGFATWLKEAVPRLKREVDDPHVCFGVSIGGDVDHSCNALNDWWPAGGHPQSFPRPILVADLMGLPPARTFAIHDGEAHLLGCSRCATPPPGLACLAIGTGVGLGLSDSTGAVVDSSDHVGARSYCLGGVPLSGARYDGIWKQWLELPGGDNDDVERVKAKPFANMLNRPWRMPWTSLVLGRRGMEMAEAAFQCPEPTDDNDEVRLPAARAYSEQWLHFLHTQFVPQFCPPTRRHTVERICFAGGVAERNWAVMREVLVEPETDLLVSTSAGDAGDKANGAKRGRAAQPKGKARVTSFPLVLPPAPEGSALIGSALYALAGMGGGARGIWAR
mmetsp:Transcript_51933/g.110366  ORF Transcript_51933/g.110366 Transcript_51933/m.110366 type:complete len:450 (-) Transcript_51933:441-1790(-)